MSLIIESGKEFEPVSRRSPSEMGDSLHARKLDRTAARGIPPARARRRRAEFSELLAKHTTPGEGIRTLHPVHPARFVLTPVLELSDRDLGYSLFPKRNHRNQAMNRYSGTFSLVSSPCENFL